MAEADVPALTGPLQQLARVLADRLQHDEASAAQAEEALVDERLRELRAGARDVLDRLEGRPSAEDREPAEELLLVRIEELVAPCDRRTEGPLSLREVPRPGDEQRKPVVEPLEERGGLEYLHARGRE